MLESVIGILFFMQIPPVIQNNLLSAILTAVIIAPATFAVTNKIFYQPQLEQLQSRNEDMNAKLTSVSKEINKVEILNEKLNNSKIQIASLSLQINDLNKIILNISKENGELKEKYTEFKVQNLNYIKSQVEKLEKDKFEIRNPDSFIFSEKKQLSLDDRALEEQLQNQINNLQSKLTCTN